MRVMLFGASGMVGQGVLRECLLDAGVEQVLAIGRTASGSTHAKLAEIVLTDLGRIEELGGALAGYDACFDSLGGSAAGRSEADYTRQTYDLTLTIAKALVTRNPGMTFIYVSGAGTDATERGPVMWARVKGRTENALLALPFKTAIMFRPAVIQPLHGIRSKTVAYRVFYTLLGPLLPLLKRAWPGYVTTTEQIGRAMLRVAREGAPKRVLETADINAL
ncbi:MAG TPA: NAD(P)H-binding protein [Thermoanaerobaculia bacterium]|nr:NAD(P)H-binding protein [Thermoanaerobaculia bacterium]